MSTITAANSKLTFTIRASNGVPIVGPFTCKGYASDDAFATEVADAAEARIGVDGIMSAGLTPFLTKQTITFAADSESIPLFENWLGAQKRLGDLLFADGFLSYPGLTKGYALVKGALTRITPMPQAKKVLEPMTYEITWADTQPAPVAAA